MRPFGDLLHEVPDVGGDEDPILFFGEAQEFRVFQLPQLRRLVRRQDVVAVFPQSLAHDRTGEVDVEQEPHPPSVARWTSMFRPG